MTEHLQDNLKRHEAGTDVPASFVINNIIPHKEPLMSRLGYFFAGVVAGAVALGAAAFMVDDVANKLEGASESDDFDDLDDGSDGVESNDCVGEPEVAGETVNPAT